MNIAINTLAYKSETVITVEKIINIFIEQGGQILIHEDFYKYINQKIELSGSISEFSSTNDLKDVDVMISIGGDGTLLNTVYYVEDLNIPILGINMGRLGFLATSTVDIMDRVLKNILDNEYVVEERTLIKLESDSDLFDGKNFALNDFTVLKRDISSMIVVHTYIDGKFLNSYWADGILVSTPTGSTAYSLSCGGPVVMPESNNFVIAPVCPHNLNVRPVIVPDNSEISFEIEGRSNVFNVSLDSRSRVVEQGIKLKISKADFTVKIIVPDEYNYLSTLRKKLSWGNDIRN